MDTELVQQGIFVFSDTFRLTNRERLLPGAEGEVGYEGELWCGRLGLYAGYSYFTKSGIEAIHGLKARAEYRIDFGCLWPNNWGELILGAEYNRDRVHGQTALVRAGWRYFFNCNKQCCGCYSNLHRYMGRRVWRNKAPWFNNEVDPTLIDRELIANLIFANNLIDGIGTQTDPATLPVGLGLLGPNDILFLLQDTGDMTAAAIINPPAGSQILGFGDQSSRVVTLPNSGTIVVQDLTGTGRARVDGGVLDPIIETASNNFICGIELIGGVTGVRQGGGVSNVRIEDVIFTNPTTTGIVSAGGGALTVNRAQITTAGTGILAVGTTGNVTVTGTTAQNTTISAATGISIENPIAGLARISNTTITTTGVGVVLDGNINTRIDRSTINATGTGMFINQIIAPPGDIRILNSSITGGSDGINVSSTSDALTFVVSGNVINGVGPLSAGINYISTATGVIASNTLITNNTVFADENGIRLAIGGTGINTAEVSNNRITMGAAPLLGAVTSTYFGTGASVNISVLNNSQLGTILGNGYEANATGATGGTYCATFVGNNRVVSNATDIVIAGNASVTLDVWDLANLSATNSGLMVTNGGFTAQALGPCPLPVIP